MDKIMNIKFREIRIFELPEMSEEELYDLILKFEEQGLIKIDEETQLHPMITDKFNNMLDEFNQVIENLLIFRENVP